MENASVWTNIAIKTARTAAIAHRQGWRTGTAWIGPVRVADRGDAPSTTGTSPPVIELLQIYGRRSTAGAIDGHAADVHCVSPCAPLLHDGTIGTVGDQTLDGSLDRLSHRRTLREGDAIRRLIEHRP